MQSLPNYKVLFVKKDHVSRQFHLDCVLHAYTIIVPILYRFGIRLDVRFYTNGMKLILG